MSGRRRLMTSESVTMGHPDKISDQISDAILDAILAEDPNGRVAAETMVTTGMVVIAGEVTTTARIDVPEIVRGVIQDIGYTDSAMGFDCTTCAVLTSLDRQSPDISQGVTKGEGLHTDQGAGDQGMMFGYACKETEELMPAPIMMSHRLVTQLAKVRLDGTLPYLRADGKAQVTIEYDGDDVKRIHTVVVSSQHAEGVSHEQLRDDIIEHVVRKSLPIEWVDDDTILHINPTGRFVVGGPMGDCGLTGRKIIVDTYGGLGRHGGGAFSGKDPSKVDRSAAYAARYVAKNIVAAGLADRCEVQLAYAIGVAEPVSVDVETYGTGKIDDARLGEIAREVFELTPAGIIRGLDLKRPIYRATAVGGHFGRSADEFPWEATDKVDALRDKAGVAV